MISRLNGRLIEKNPTNLLIECAGVGYDVKISLNTFSALPDAEAIVLHTKLIVREDAHILYGFATKEEREMFGHLISVSGIGPNTALIMLSSMTPDDIAQATLILGADLYKRKDSVGGVLGLSELGAIRMSPLGRDISAMVRAYRRESVA